MRHWPGQARAICWGLHSVCDASEARRGILVSYFPGVCEAAGREGGGCPEFARRMCISHESRLTHAISRYAWEAWNRGRL